MQNEYKVHEGQTLFDVAMHNYGSVEAAFELAASTGLSLTDKLRPETVIQLSGQQTNPYVVASIQNRNLVPRTAADAMNEAGGIGHMQIWVSFQVGAG